MFIIFWSLLKQCNQPPPPPPPHQRPEHSRESEVHKETKGQVFVHICFSLKEQGLQGGIVA